MKDDFHELALQSILFKGRSDSYFCYLKSEKIAHVLMVLAEKSGNKDTAEYAELLSLASRLPHTILHVVAGEIDTPILLADILSILSMLRFSVTQGYISKENGAIIADEYENLVRKIAAESHPSPFVSGEDFTVQEIKLREESRLVFRDTLPAISSRKEGPSIKDNPKGHDEGSDKGHNKRMSLILDFVSKNKGVSIKEISAVIKGCSEKTIQRELASLIQKGLVERQGERRWSTYTARGSRA